MKHCALLVNPAAGNGCFFRIKTRLFQAFKNNQLEVEVFISESVEKFAQLAEELAKQFTILLIAGGDSALSIAVNAIKSNFPLIGFIPLGTCNDIARHFQLFPLESYLQKIKNENFRKIPLGRISTSQFSRLFIGQCSCGAAELLNRELTRKKNSSALWKTIPPFLAGLLVFKKVQPNLLQYYSMQTDQKQLSGMFSLIVISLIDYFSCGLKLFNSENSSKLHLLALQKDRLSFFLKTYLQLKRTPELCSSQILRLKDITSIILQAPNPFGLQYDGEIFSEQPSHEYHIEIVPERLPLIC